MYVIILCLELRCLNQLANTTELRDREKEKVQSRPQSGHVETK